jgi:hypothetical protein
LAPAYPDCRCEDHGITVLLGWNGTAMGIRTSDEVMLNSRFSYESVQRLAVDHGERIVTSLDLDWDTLLLETRKKPATVDLRDPPRLQILL